MRVLINLQHHLAKSTVNYFFHGISFWLFLPSIAEQILFSVALWLTACVLQNQYSAQ
jgi:hypothetical protein